MFLSRNAGLRFLKHTTTTQVAAAARSSPPRWLASIAEPVAAYQKSRWDAYLASGRGANELFDSMDTTRSGDITPEEIKVFLASVLATTHKLKPNAFLKLDELSQDHAITLPEFQEWLIEATKAKDEPTSVQSGYQTHPHVGPRSPASHAKGQFNWNESTMSQSLRRMQYAVRGEIVMKADEMKAQGRKITFTNIGNPHALGQQPITYYRQVLALCDLPSKVGIDHVDAPSLFPADVLQRAREMRDNMIGACGTGAYTNSQGIPSFRQHVADYIAQRDDQPAYAGDVFLTNGASSAIDMILTGLISCDKDAILIPIVSYICCWRKIMQASLLTCMPFYITCVIFVSFCFAAPVPHLFRLHCPSRWTSSWIRVG